MWFGLVRFYDISTILGYLIPNSFYTFLLNINDLVSTILDYLMLIFYTYTLPIYDLVWLGFMAYQQP